MRLPVNYRLDCNEVYIRKDLDTGDVIISKKPGSWECFFELMDSVNDSEDMEIERDNDSLQEKDLF